MIVYLAGPINGCTDNESITWRQIVKNKMGEDNCLDPMRRDYRGIEDQNVSVIVEGDKTDIRKSDVMLANCWQISWGTAMEILYAYEYGIPVITVVAPSVRISPWLKYHSTVYDSLDDAIDLLEGQI